ncbi:MAG: 3-dehydroquinate synthase [Chitinophagaceae bacterium]|nr:MAG: 3-dehydroquinate synthase [Chitinophagaceae bacterium]
MKKVSYTFSSRTTDYYFDGDFSKLKELVGSAHTVLVTDENVYNAHKRKFAGYDCIVLKPGEEFKVQATVNSIIEQLIEFKTDRKSIIVGIGGGVITDLTGFVASTYMRGVNFGFVPTTILAMVDASIGGKNGIDVGLYKNLVGVIRQPSFLLYDVSFLKSLPNTEWINGFAEIIKHSCIKDLRLFKELEQHKLSFYKKDLTALKKLIRKNATIKSEVVKNDEFEMGERKLLNFGHTVGHAIENMYELSHGQAISIGMTVACGLSQIRIGFRDTGRVVKVLKQYGLPTYAEYDKPEALKILKMDKKKDADKMNFVLLQKIGKAIVHPIPLTELETIFAG